MRQRSQSPLNRGRAAQVQFFVRRFGLDPFDPSEPAQFGVYRRCGVDERLVCGVRDEDVAEAFRDLLEDHLKTLAFLS